jgi:hypothetical protein
MKNGGSVNVTLIAWDLNPWNTIFTGSGLIVYQTVFTLLFLGNVALTLYKIFQWKLQRGFSLSIGLICLYMEVAVNSTRVIQQIVAPNFNIYSLPNYESVSSVAFCFTLITGILVIFFWFDLTTDPFFHKSGKCLGIMKIPAIVVISILLLIEILTDLIRNFLMFDALVICLMIYVSLYFLIGIFYFIAGWRILAISKTSNSKKKLRNITYRIVCSGAANIIAGLAMLSITTPITFMPGPFIILNAIFYLAIFAQSLLLITIFSPGKNPEKSSPSKTLTPNDVPLSNKKSTTETE